MPITFFNEQQRAKKEAEILKYLEETDVLLAASNQNSEQLIKRRDQLKDFLTMDVSERLKRALRKSSSQLSGFLDESNNMDESEESVMECLLQIPSAEDLSHMKYMPAGAGEDQQQRLTHMANVVSAHTSLPIITTASIELSKQWHNLFKAIALGKKSEASRMLKHMSEDDPLLRLILQVHTLKYLQTLITHCIDAQAVGFNNLGDDIVITPKTFELLIHDLATTLHHRNSLYFSFGLPSHHAYTNEGRGFCILNKIAILLKNAEQTHAESLTYLIIGTDINRDNGLCQILRDSASHLDITHIDVFDSRVYPGHTLDDIVHEFPKKPMVLDKGIVGWPHQHYNYWAVDLALQTKTQGCVHPAIVFAVKQIQKQIELAHSKNQQMMLLLPTGWDSHEDETAFCGRFVGDHYMSKAERQKQRFSTSDLAYFYQQVLQLYKGNKESIAGIYWGLEGGYNRAMYEQQIQLMLNTISAELAPQNQPAIALT